MQTTDEAARKMRSTALSVSLIIAVVVILYLLLLAFGFLPSAGPDPEHVQAVSGENLRPDALPLWSALPFASLLLCIAVLPLLRSTAAWWHSNKNRLIVASGFGAITLLFYTFIHPGHLENHFTHVARSAPGWHTAFAAFSNAIFAEYVPFIILLFCLYVISGGVGIKGDLPAHPGTNTAFLGVGTLLASLIGTTGAAMVLIRPVLLTNQERRYQRHTVIFFIFTVCNCGGLLLPIGDPPLFLGYLRGVPFTWTLSLWPYWLAVNSVLLITYFVWDTIVYRREKPADIRRDETQVRPLRLEGAHHLAILLGIVICVALVVPGTPFLGTSFVPPVFFREMLMLLLVAVSLLAGNPRIRIRNRFNYEAIIEVAVLFGGIFTCMQPPIEILHLQGASLGLDTSSEFFWATGILSSFLDNAPTYVVFFETASAMTIPGLETVMLSTGREIIVSFLVPISLGAVFMGANTYIGNGPNFMVKSIAEQSGVPMPSFFGYMLYSITILVPIFLVLTFVM